MFIPLLAKMIIQLKKKKVWEEMGDKKRQDYEWLNKMARAKNVEEGVIILKERIKLYP